MPITLLSHQVQARLITSHNNKTLMSQRPPLCGVPILRSIIQRMVSDKAALAHTAPVKDTTTCSADLHLYPTPNVSSLSDPLTHFIQICRTCKLKASPPPHPVSQQQGPSICVWSCSRFFPVALGSGELMMSSYHPCPQKAMMPTPGMFLTVIRDACIGWRTCGVPVFPPFSFF